MKRINFLFDGRVLSPRMTRVAYHLALVLLSLEVRTNHGYEEFE